MQETFYQYHVHCLTAHLCYILQLKQIKKIKESVTVISQYLVAFHTLSVLLV